MEGGEESLTRRESNEARKEREKGLFPPSPPSPEGGTGVEDPTQSNFARYVHVLVHTRTQPILVPLEALQLLCH